MTVLWSVRMTSPDFMDGRREYGGVAIFWKRTMSDFVEKLDIACDRIAGIQLFLPNRDPLFIFSVYLPSSSHSHNDYMWSTLTSYGHCVTCTSIKARVVLLVTLTQP